MYYSVLVLEFWSWSEVIRVESSIDCEVNYLPCFVFCKIIAGAKDKWSSDVDSSSYL